MAKSLPRKLLIANRGEIAVRVMRSARELGIATVAVYSEADRDALHVRLADEAFLIGAAPPSQSYLNAEKLLDVARRSESDALHPGYGFFAENAAFARAVIEAGLLWIGPHPAAIEAMGDKLRARALMREAGVPVVPGGSEPLADPAAAREAAERYGLPLALKASGGGGGKGLKVARTLDEIEAAFSTAQREATAYFKNPILYAERFLENPKHIELQILADKSGHVIHVGERDCSLQRRHQKLWEEAPARIGKRVRRQLREAGLQAARTIGYDSVGTIEFLVAENDCYFLEMNTRIQVEHTVTELVTGIDLVAEQIRIAAGDRLQYEQDDVDLRGHAIEIRVNAEDPARNFAPAAGTISSYHEPGGFGVRIDSAAFSGWTIPPDYDSLIAKLIVWGASRDEALARLRRACAEYGITGLPTTLQFLRALADEPSVISGEFGTATLEAFATTYAPDEPAPQPPTATANGAPSDEIRVEVNDKLFRVRFIDLDLGAGRTPTARRAPPRAVPARARAAAGNELVAPLHGVVAEILVAPGDSVQEGQVLVVIEAMKMMNEIRAHRAGTVSRVSVTQGASVEANAPLVTLE
jgi:acetyl-CoA/propionyl-CoA carboxylase biotin carboxyl carrier protein